MRFEFLIDSFWTFSNHLTAHAQICMIRLKSFEHSNKKKSVKTFIKAVKRLSSINVHFVMHGQSDSEESFSSVTSSAHGNHDKSNNLWKLIYRAEKQGECLNKFLKILNANNKTCWITFNENWNWQKIEFENFIWWRVLKHIEVALPS